MQTQLRSASLTVTINSIGAEVCSVKNNSALEFIWQAKKEVWARHAPVLFPIVGKLKNNFFIYNQQQYELPQHGFARDLEFELIDKNDNSCTFQLSSNETTKKTFPFEFIFQIRYGLEENKLTTQYTIFNPSSLLGYYSVGAHPGFNCPLLPGEKFEDYYLEFDTNHLQQTQLNNGLRVNAKSTLELKDNKLQLTKNLFDNDALVFENSQVNTISLCSSTSKHKITLQCKNWPYFGVWAKKGTDEFVCLEPWYGIADSENSSQELLKKDGIIQLPPVSEFKGSFSLIFS